MITSTPVRQYTFASKTQRGQRYTVNVLRDAATCTCPGWERHRRCWHVTKAINLSKGVERKMPEPTTETAVVVAEQERQSTALVPIEVHPPAVVLPTQGEISVMAAIAARAVAAQGLVPKDIDTPDKAFAVMLAGWEVGCKPMTALRHVYVVNGRTELDAQLSMGVVRARDPSAEFIFHETTGAACEIELRRGGEKIIRLRCTIDDVPKALRDKPGPWSMYRIDMLRWFTLRRVCRLGAPDLINAISGIDVGEASETMGALGEGIEPIDVQALPVEALVNEGDEPVAEAELVPEEPGEGDAVEAEAEEAAVPAPVPEKAATQPKVKSLADLWNRGLKLGYPNKLTMLSALGYTDDTQVVDLADCWERLEHIAASKTEAPA